VFTLKKECPSLGIPFSFNKFVTEFMIIKKYFYSRVYQYW